MGGDLAEGYPYWLNGLVPLVALLNDTSYIEALHAQLEHILSNASAPEDKQWLGPLDERSTRAKTPPFSGAEFCPKPVLVNRSFLIL
eukprot:COSAG06_NODE_3603_length_5131_cov_5.927862_4_plen_87_part_00